MKSLRELIFEYVRAEGFEEVGAVDLASPIAKAQLTEHVARYDRWLVRGFHGLMQYLLRGRDRRADPRLVLPGTQAVISALRFYDPRAYGDGVREPQYARYLRGVDGNPDYHEALSSALERAMARALAEWQAAGNRPFVYKVCVDTSAVLERTWANLAGLGWLGRNSLLIHTQRGSYSFIGTVLIDQALEATKDLLPPRDLCGSCSRCVEACPTQALIPDPSDPTRVVLNATQCISYWTLEARGALELSPEKTSKVGTWVAGCDICQDVCPFNNKAQRSAERHFGTDVSRPPTWIDHEREIQDSSGVQYGARAKVSALSRIKFADFQRNFRIVSANRDQASSTEEKHRR